MHSKRLGADNIIKCRMVCAISYVLILFYVTATEHGHGLYGYKLN